MDRLSNRGAISRQLRTAAAHVLVGLTLTVFLSACNPSPQTLPTDARDDCPLSSATFASWFQSGNVTLDGVVNPADSLHFPNIPNCSFYQWSEQMFMWLTSPRRPQPMGAAVDVSSLRRLFLMFHLCNRMAVVPFCRTPRARSGISACASRK